MTIKAGEYKWVIDTDGDQRTFDANGNVIHYKNSYGNEYWYDSEGDESTKEQFDAIHSPCVDKIDINKLVDKFLQWELPSTVCSDLCASTAGYPHTRTGTNLLTYIEAKQMLEYLLLTKE